MSVLLQQMTALSKIADRAASGQGRALDQGALRYSIHVDMFTLHRETQARSKATAGLADSMKRARTSCLVGQDLEVRPQLLLELTCSALTQV